MISVSMQRQCEIVKLHWLIVYLSDIVRPHNSSHALLFKNNEELFFEKKKLLGPVLLP